ncbi:MAG: hypothetical protein AAGI27_00470 [Pseudomonadota bacterium]
MTRDTRAPDGLYVLSGFMLLGVIAAIFYAYKSPSFLVVALVFGLPLLYSGLGLVRKWKGARVITIVLLSLVLLLAVANLAGLLLLDIANELGEEVFIRQLIQNGIRALVLPAALLYLFSKRVRSFYADKDLVG